MAFLQNLQNHPKILNFGRLSHSFIGIPVYMDPNILFNIDSKNKDKINYEYKVDIWSLGILCYELLVGTTPFDGNDNDELINCLFIKFSKISSF